MTAAWAARHKLLDPAAGTLAARGDF